MSRAVVVGNGPLSDADREDIERLAHDGATVYRFNDFWNKNYERDEPVDVHVKKRGALWAPRRRFRFPDRADHPTMKSKRIADYNKPVFVGCDVKVGKKLKSTGTQMLSRLESDKKVGAVDVFGMNWNFSGKMVHSTTEDDVVHSCCTKCTIHETPTQDYVPPPTPVLVVPA